MNLRTFPPRSAWAAGSQTQGAGQHQRARVLVPPAVSGEGQLSPDQAQYPVAAEDAGRPAGEDGRAALKLPRWLQARRAARLRVAKVAAEAAVQMRSVDERQDQRTRGVARQL